MSNGKIISVPAQLIILILRKKSGHRQSFSDSRKEGKIPFDFD
ncbi:hypothetical protein PQ459_10660 [Chryseobacterium sp. KACC 21268]|nr:hypothetical protein PQ459_10660 [Chryseobacterium sp. KACC 21268]